MLCKNLPLPFTSRLNNRIFLTMTLNQSRPITIVLQVTSVRGIELLYTVTEKLKACLNI